MDYSPSIERKEAEATTGSLAVIKNSSLINQGGHSVDVAAAAVLSNLNHGFFQLRRSQS